MMSMARNRHGVSHCSSDLKLAYPREINSYIHTDPSEPNLVVIKVAMNYMCAWELFMFKEVSHQNKSLTDSHF